MGNADSVKTVLNLDMVMLIPKFFCDIHVKISSRPVSLWGRISGYTLKFGRYLHKDDNYLSHFGGWDHQVCRVRKRKAYTWILMLFQHFMAEQKKAACKGDQKILKVGAKLESVMDSKGNVCFRMEWRVMPNRIARLWKVRIWKCSSNWLRWISLASLVLSVSEEWWRSSWVKEGEVEMTRRNYSFTDLIVKRGDMYK